MPEVPSIPSQRRSIPKDPSNFRAVLAEQYTVSDGLVAKLDSRFWDTVDHVSGLVINPDQQAAVQEYAKTVHWLAFGRPGDPAPRGYVFRKVEEDGKPDAWATLDERIPYLNRALGSHVGRIMMSAGWDEMSQAVRAELDSRKPHIEATLKQFITQTEEYQLLASFNNPESTRARRPLTNAEKMSAEARAKGEVQRDSDNPTTQRTGLIMPGTGEHFTYRHKTYPIEDQRVQGKVRENPKDGLQRARNYLTRLAQEQADASGLLDGQTIKKISVYERKTEDYVWLATDVKTRDAQGNDIDRPSVSWIEWDTSRRLHESVYAGDEALQSIALDFARAAFRMIMHKDSKTLGEALQKATAQATEYVMRSLEADILQWDFEYPGEDILMVRMPSNAINAEPWENQSDDDHEISTWFRLTDKDEYFMSEYEYILKKNKTIGQVTRFDESSVYGADRLIINGADTSMGGISGGEDLIMSLRDFEGIPAVPGFTLVSREGYSYGFTADSKGDPYAPCKVIVGGEECAKLAEKYEEIGLVALANEIKEKEIMTVDELVTSIKGNSVYMFPEESGFVELEKWEDFGAIVKDGKLQTQAHAAAQLLQNSLDYAFGAGTSVVTTGNVIRSSDERITASIQGHVIFVYDGKQYILNAMPHGDGSPESKTSIPITKPAPNIPKADRSPASADYSNQEVATKTVDQRLGELAASLTERLLVAYGVPNENTLKEEVLYAQQKEEPARRMYDLLNHVRNGKITNEQAIEIADRIIRSPELKLDVRRSLRIDHYSQGFLEQLATSAWHLRSILDGKAD